MSISKLALAAKKVIDAAWQNGPSYDLASQAAFALESAQLLQSPDTAAELKRLQERVTELEAERRQWRRTAHNLAGEAGLVPRDDVTPQVRKLRNLLAGQRATVEGEHYTAVHHDYRISHDLPQAGGR